jgi:hypothetical protein
MLENVENKENEGAKDVQDTAGDDARDLEVASGN